MPSVITCLVAKRLGGKAFVNHWELRDFTASLVAFICKRCILLFVSPDEFCMFEDDLGLRNFVGLLNVWHISYEPVVYLCIPVGLMFSF